jgi:hypothetical protein
MKIEMTLDLAPFAAGLKSAIRMTDSAADQMQKIMQGQKIKPDYSVIEKELNKLAKYYDNLEKEAKETDSVVNNFGKGASPKLKSLIGNLATLGLAYTSVGAAAAGLKRIITSTLAASAKEEQANKKVEQAVLSTGQAAGYTANELKIMASQLQEITTVGNEEILGDVTAQLLTFTNITGEQFERTQKAALNLSTVLDGDLKSASIQLGKALNDPISNLGALSRSGIQFSDEQKEVIKSLAKTNRLAEAQTIILDELDKQYGGQAEAMSTTYSGRIKQFQNAWGDLQETIGFAVLPVLADLADVLKTTAKNTSDFFIIFKNNSLEGTIQELKDMGVAAERLQKLELMNMKLQLLEQERILSNINKENRTREEIESDINNNIVYREALYNGLAELQIKYQNEVINLEKQGINAEKKFQGHKIRSLELIDTEIFLMEQEIRASENAAKADVERITTLQNIESLKAKIAALSEGDPIKPPEHIDSDELDASDVLEKTDQQLKQLAELQQKYDLLAIEDKYKRAEEELRIQRDADLKAAQESGASNEFLLQIRNQYAEDVKALHGKMSEDEIEAKRKSLEAEIEAKRKSLEAEIDLVSKKKELGVATYDEIRQVMQRYVEFAKTTYGEESQEYINALNNMRAANLQWGQDNKVTYSEMMEDITGISAEYRQKISSLYSQISNQISGIFSQLSTNMRAEQEKEVESVEEAERKKLEAIEARAEREGWTERRLAGEKEKIEEQYSKKKEALDKKHEKEQRKLKQKQQAANIAMATIDTANAVMKTYAQWGYPWGIIPAAAIGLIGAYKIKLMADQKFAKGGLISGGQKLIQVNELGPEYVLNHQATKTLGIPLLNYLNQNPDAGRGILANLPRIPAMPRNNQVAYASGGSTASANNLNIKLDIDKLEKKLDSVVKAIEIMNLNLVNKGFNQKPVNIVVETSDPETTIRKMEDTKKRIIQSGGDFD